LRRLKDYPQFPKILKAGKDHNVIEWAGGRTRSYQGLLEIVEILKKEGITHRDINPQNLCMKDGQLMLIDFGWALIDGEGDMNPPEGLGRGNYIYGEWDDELAARRVMGERYLQRNG
jgi:serine/threonine protein kinase